MICINIDYRKGLQMDNLILDMVIYENMKKKETEANSGFEQLQLEIPEYDHYVDNSNKQKEEEPKRVIEIEL
jgi:hypothetical protein